MPGTLFFPFLLVLIGVIAVIYGGVNLRKAMRSKGWPGAKGRILSSEVRAVQWSRGIEYRPQIHYVYFVDNDSYTSSRISFSDFDYANNTRQDVAQKVVSRYPVGAAVDVYYDPGDPGNSVLENGVKMAVFVPIILGIVFSLVGVALGIALSS